MERLFTETFLSCKSIVHVPYDEVENTFRHSAMNFSPRTTYLFATVKAYE